ncbi:MAG TPA: tripartite tricarboxylate transporter TctB family protein [Paracoccaceae bacterium]
MSSDRIFGLVVVFGALAMFAGALQIQTSFLSDPVGPKVFPMIIAVVALLCGLMILWKPDTDPEWPAGAVWSQLGIAVAVLIAYSYLLTPLGFIVPTALASAVISFQISPRLKPAVITGTSLSAGLYVMFKYGLGLGLVALPKALIG